MRRFELRPLTILLALATLITLITLATFEPGRAPTNCPKCGANLVPMAKHEHIRTCPHCKEYAIDTTYQAPE